MSARTAAAILTLTFTASLAFGQAPPAVADSDEGCPEARIIEYLERHGDYGRIDPETMLALSRAMKESLDADRYGISAIGGSTWKSIGPTNGAGRATSIGLHPTQVGTAIIGTAGGGAWKTTDNGATWRVLTDDIPNLSAGAIAYAPSNPSIVYLGTGEGGVAADFIPGIGLLMSSDGGETWTLPSSVIATQFYRLYVNPADANDVLAATNSGLLRSVNGQNGPFKNVINSVPQSDAPGYGDVTDLVRDPSNPKTMYVTTWDRRFWCARTATACSASQRYQTPTVMKSTDGGSTWAPASSGLPVSTTKLRVNRMSIAIAPSSPQTLYVATSILDDETGKELSHIYKSTDGAGTWTETGLSSNTTLNTYMSTQAWYGNTIVVSPVNPDIVISGGVGYIRTLDGGNTWARTLTSVHVDVHELKFDAANALWIANDGGVWTTNDNATAVTDRTRGLVTRQFYDLANDPVNRNRVYGGQQDNGTIYRGDNNGTQWASFSGGDGFACEVNPHAPAIAYSTIQYGIVLRTVTAGSLFRVVERTPAYDTDEVKPFFSIVKAERANPATVYAASYRVWKSTTAGDAWVPLSTTLSGSGTWFTDAAIRTMTLSTSNPRVIMVATGSPRRRVYRTTNGGEVWADVTSNLPTGRTILKLEIDPSNDQHVFAALAGTARPGLFMTTDGGSTWQPRAEGLPPFSVQTVRFDPTDVNTLYAGTDVGVYRSTDGGATWARFGSGMPAVSVYDVDPTDDGSILRAATHGRGVWELEVTDPHNDAPAVDIESPAGKTATVTKGQLATFTGTFSDKNGDAISANWTFPDSWTSVPAESGVTVKHRFERAGRYPVGLAAIDTKGGVGADTIEVQVVDPSDTCATPMEIPSSTFPSSVSISTDLTSKHASDPQAFSSCYPFTTQTSSWMSFTAPVAGDYQFALCGSVASAVLIGYTGNCGLLTANPMCLTWTTASDSCPSQTLSMTAGETIRLFVANYFTNDFGDVTVTVTQNSSFTPLVSSIAPALGPYGAPVVINGRGFQNGATVTIGGIPATNVKVISPRLITATVGTTGGGNATIAVTNPDGTTGTLANGFSYAVESGSKRRAVKR